MVNLVLLSDIGLIAWVWCLFRIYKVIGLSNFVFFYFVPYLIACHWLVTITFLQHTDWNIDRYKPCEWTWLRGAFGTIDRDYGAFLNYAFHHIHDSHVIHHLFGTMPHYNAIKATQCLQESAVFKKYYMKSRETWYGALWNIVGRGRWTIAEGNENIPAISKANGLNTMVGVWLNSDLENNEKELANGIAAAKEGHVDILAVGNEVLLRGDLSQDQLLDYINRAKQALPDVDVGYVDAYFEFEDYPQIADACDVILANCYPFWEGCPADYSLLYMKDMYRRAVKAGKGKRVIITETGWPNVGSAERGAEPSYENALKYFINTYLWAEEEDIEIFYFSSFDETWKVADEGDVGAYWGLWDKDGKMKYV